MILGFPDNFLWGSSLSAYQAEGGIAGSDWSRAYPAGDACGHYKKYEEDFDLLSRLHQSAFRFSIEWSRVEPQDGFFDQQEINHYIEVLQSLKRRRIKTMVTLHHFTNPMWVADMGGWENPKIVSYFSRFAERILGACGDLVDFWITINEPLVYAAKGYIEGSWPPGKKNSPLFLKVLRNQALAHRKVYDIFHGQKQFQVHIGVAANNIFFEPAAPKFLNRTGVALADWFWNKRFLNHIKDSMDFIGLNYYFRREIAFPSRVNNANKKVSDIGWEIYPEGMYHILKTLRHYKKPIYITENGVADAKDMLRKDFIRDHLYWTHKTIGEKVDVRGYFHWSLMDNFEWDKGFGPRFGLVEVDFKNLARLPRPSAHYYAEICKNNGLEY